MIGQHAKKDVRVHAHFLAVEDGPLFQRASFWDTLMGVVKSSEARYVDYSYRERADCYSAALSLAALERLRDSAKLVKYTTLQQQIRHTDLETVDLFVTR